MTQVDGIESLDEQVVALETSLGNVTTLTGQFQLELDKMQATVSDANREVSRLSSGFAYGLRRSIDDLVLDGETLSSTMERLAESFAYTAYNTAVRPVTDHVGGLLGTGAESLMNLLTPFAKGGAFSQGRVTPFATGGIVGGPTYFPMRGGTGLMGEAGPEAIMPLTRGADGKLGVQAAGGGRPINVTMNIQTRDAQSFQRSQGQIASQVNRALARANRNR